MTEKTPTGARPHDTAELRLQALEELCAHQASEIESLSDQVRDQWDKIDQITNAMLRLRDRVTEVEEAGPSGPGGHENTRPPHY